MAERKDAAAALELTPKIDDFIRKGTLDDRQGKKQRRDQTSSPTEPVSKNQTPLRTTKEKRRLKTTAISQGSPEFVRTLSRARIQKSIRFLPQLIARFEEHARTEESSGRKPPSIQDAMNEALEQWLSKNQ